MTAKKRARNKTKKAAAATAAATVAAAQPAVEPGRPNAATAPRSQSKSEPQHDLESQIQRQADDSLPRKDDIKEDVDICVHGLDLQYSNERLKETISVCDDVVSKDIAVIHEVFSGKMPQLESIFGGRESLQNVIDEKLNDLFNGDKAANVDAGIVCTLLAKHPEVCDNPIHFKWVISHFLSEGTQCLLQGDTQAARGNAYFASCFSQIMDLMIKGKMMNIPKMMRLYSADEHTLCSFYRNRIPCSCLRKRYKEVKSVEKTDMCWNIACSKPDRFKVDSRSMMCCSRCRQAYYCCSECQEIDWPRHKNLCGWAKDVREVFGAKHIIELKKNEVWNRTFAPLFSKEIQHLKKIGINENDNPLTVRPPIAEEN
ncbi:hypothetical protein QTG54_011221 [Skeletonema marinoi]|uniref:MYND-type domain-containing protein n=1 Tax=Skeletonema marinoi TaxID=267567 RepID=A0AAD8Y1Z5_9STRA|nr:hypothetical protein QTG54_011221 [Skeletonema marinoi]